MAKGVVPAFLEAQEVAAGREGAVVEREENKIRANAKKNPKEGE